MHRLKAAHPDLFVGINGGLKTLAEGIAASEGLDGMMLGRAAYQDSSLLAAVTRMCRIR